METYKKGNTMKKLSQKLTSLLVRARTADTSSKDTIRREFNTGELVMIRKTPWTNYSLNEDDLNKLKQIKHLVGSVLQERQCKKQGKKARRNRRLEHNQQQNNFATDDLNEENVYDEDLCEEFSNTEVSAEVSQINVNCEVTSQAA